MSLSLALLALLLAGPQEAVVDQGYPGGSFAVWLCPDHRGHPEDGPGLCAVCGRPLASRRLATLWSCPMHPQTTRSTAGACPVCGMTLVSTTRELEWFCAEHADVVRAEPGACPRDGRALSLRGRSMPHGDHNPRHGGLLFMAEDRFHHLEGALGPDGALRLYFYDDFTRPLPVLAFRARVEGRELQPSADGSFLALDPAADPSASLELTVHVRFPQSEREEVFDFVLSQTTREAPPPAAGVTDPLSSTLDSAGLMDAIRERRRRVDDLVRRGAWPDLFIPALEAKDLALALLAREGDKVALPVKTLVRAAWLLDLHGDLGKKAEVEAAHRLFVRGMAELEKAHGR